MASKMRFSATRSKKSIYGPVIERGGELDSPGPPLNLL
jgi:hypothetical protein